MSKEQKLKKILANILEIDNVTLDTVLDSRGSWDSLAMISFIAEAGEAFECAISPEDLREAQTASDLLKLV